MAMVNWRMSLGLAFFLSITLLFPNLTFSTPTNMFTAVNTTMRGCERQCGNLTIPYPFGMNKGCAMGIDYILDCVEGSNHTSVLAGISETDITLNAAFVHNTCKKDRSSLEVVSIGMFRPICTLSSSANVFVVLGCNVYGSLELPGGDMVRCVSACQRFPKDLFDKRCVGSGCCQVPIPKGLQFVQTRLNKLESFDPLVSVNCSYTIVVKKSSFTFGGVVELEQPGYAERLRKLPVVYEWFVPNSCDLASRNLSSFACKMNSKCVDISKSNNIDGYRCVCIPGYEGNPYIGCTDYNECATNPCVHTCHNHDGGYECSCRRGYRGDGKRNGSGCIAINFTLIIILGIASGFIFVFLIIGGYWGYHYMLRRKLMMEREKNLKRNRGLLLQQNEGFDENITERTHLFTLDELNKATDNYSDDRVLGHGGQGIVYKGMLSDGVVVAVKKSTSSESCINEIALLVGINHRNIVKLVGYCLETPIPQPIYEFLPNGTLTKNLHHPNGDFSLTWSMRLQIALDIAGAISYLHSDCCVPILHKDIKSDNIMLDGNYRGILCDFGTSRFIGLDKSHLITRLQGTIGYYAPEYFAMGRYTEKSDVFSFGVVLAELLTGKKASYKSGTDSGISLISSFVSAMNKSTLHELLDEQVVNEAREETISAIARLIRQALMSDEDDRPSMKEVYLELEVVSRQEIAQISFLKASSSKVTAEDDLKGKAPIDYDGGSSDEMFDENFPELLRSAAALRIRS